MLYPNTSKPLYEQLKDALKHRIDCGEYKPDEKLPGERQLIDMYQVSRMTVRQAIGDLVNEGLLYRMHGKGTYVSQVKIERPLAKLLGVAEELSLEGYNVDIEIISAGMVTADAEVCKALKLAEHSRVFMINRRVLANNQPVLVDYSYCSEVIGNLFSNVDLSKEIIFTHLEKCGYKISHGEQWISADKLSKEDALHLGCRPNSPALIIKRTTFVENDVPIKYGRIIYRSDRYEYYIKLKRNNLELK